MKKIINDIHYKEYLLFFSILMFFPRPFKTFNNEYIVYLILSFYMLFVIFKRTPKILNQRMNKVIVLLFLMSGYFHAANIIMGRLSVSNIINASKPIFMIMIILFSYAVTSGDLGENKIKHLKYDLSVISIIMIVGQLFISFFQIFEFNVFEFIYVAEKSNPLGSILRVSGTLNNPNTMAWMVTMFSLIFISFNKDVRNRFICIGLSFTLVLLSGSRSTLLLYPFSILILMMMEGLSNSFNWKQLFKILFGFIFSVALMFMIVYLLKDYMKYMSQIFQIFEGGLSSISSFASRFDIWKDGFEELTSSLGSILFGVSKSSFTAADNDLIYAAMRHGIIGLGLYLCLYVFIVIESLSNSKYRNLLITIIIILFIAGIQAETMTSWIRPIPLFVLLGLVLSDKFMETSDK